jgi:RNA recognition motif-containing protein
MPRVYIGNLASSVTSEDLTALFSVQGKVRGALVITDRTSGVSRGFGFVDMVDAEDATAAIESLNDADLNGKKIRIEQALQSKPDVERRERRGRRRAPSSAA